MLPLTAGPMYPISTEDSVTSKVTIPCLTISSTSKSVSLHWAGTLGASSVIDSSLHTLAKVEENAAHLPTALASLPGGGIGHGASFQVTDQAQEMDLHFNVTHQARCFMSVSTLTASMSDENLLCVQII